MNGLGLIRFGFIGINFWGLGLIGKKRVKLVGLRDTWNLREPPKQPSGQPRRIHVRPCFQKLLDNPQRKAEASPNHITLPIGSIVVPFFVVYIWERLRQSQQGTTKEPMGND